MRWITCGLAGLIALGIVATQGRRAEGRSQHVAGTLANGGTPACASCHAEGRPAAHFWTHWSAPAHRTLPVLRRG